MATSTLSSKYHISIPLRVREEQHWKSGQAFVFIPKGKGVLIMSVPELSELAGIAKGANTDNYCVIAINGFRGGCLCVVRCSFQRSSQCRLRS